MDIIDIMGMIPDAFVSIIIDTDLFIVMLMGTTTIMDVAVKEDSSEPALHSLHHSICIKDPRTHWEMIEGLASRYKVEECNFNTIFGTFPGLQDLR